MAYSGLSCFIETLRNNDEIIDVRSFVDPVLEISEIADRFSKSELQNKALLFHQTGTSFPLLINQMGSDNRIRLALSIESLDSITQEIIDIIEILTVSKKSFGSKVKSLKTIFKIASYAPIVKKGRGACQEIVLDKVDLSILPVLQCWPKDAGRFITLPLVHTHNPINGTRNLGMYRMQIFSSNTTGMHWHTYKGAGTHFNEWKKLNKRMPISVALGGDPIYTYAATAPLPENIDEYLFAGFIRKKKVSLVKCITNDIEVPEDADIVLEGYIDTEELFNLEGPFGDHTGFYSLPGLFPVFHVTCITHRKNAIYPATIVGIPPQEDYYFAKATGAFFLPLIQKTMLPELTGMSLPAVGTGHALTIVSIKKTYPGQVQKLMHSLWGAGQMIFNKVLIVVDDETVLTDFTSLLSSILQNCNFKRDLYFSKGSADILDHAAVEYGFGGKLCIDASSKADIAVHYYFDKKILESDIIMLNEIISNEDVMCDTSLVEIDFPVVFLISHTSKDRFLLLVNKVAYSCKSLKAIILLDSNARNYNLFYKTWYFLSNIDPARDIKIINNSNNEVLLIDGMSKSKALGETYSEWPEVITSDVSTIERIDARWLSLGLGSFISSPSMRFL